jgi:hypothetical protein
MCIWCDEEFPDDTDYDEDGYDPTGYDKDGFDRGGLNRRGHARDDYEIIEGTWILKCKIDDAKTV